MLIEPKEPDESTNGEGELLKPKSRARRGKRKRSRKSSKANPSPRAAAFPRHGVKKALRVPRAILEQNAGKACTDREAAKFCGVNYHGPFGVEISSAIKYGFLH